MTLHDFIKLIFKKKQTFISVLFVFLLIAGCVVILQKPRYGSDINLLVVRVTTGDSVDPYVVSRSNEQLSELLVRMAHSYTFFEKVLDSDFAIKDDYFSGIKEDRIKKWKRAIKVKTLADTGIIEIRALHPDRNQAEQLAKAVAYILQVNHKIYHGYGDSIQLREIDTSITSKYPVEPNLFIIFSATFIFSALFFLVYIYSFPEENYDIRLWPKIRAKKKKENISEPAYNWSSVGEVLAEKRDIYKISAQPVEKEKDDYVEEGIKEEIVEEIKHQDYKQEEEKFESGSMNNVIR